MNLGRDWYFTQVGPLDKRAQKLPFPDSLAGRLVEYVTSHEVGHTIGFPDNFKASSMYPVDSVRSKTWVAKMGHTPTLDKWAKMQDTVPWYRFASDGGAQGADPGEQSEAVGDADAVKATGLGIKNLKRVMGFPESASAWKEGDNFDNLEELYGRTVGQWATELGHVARVVGGVYKQEKMVGQKGPVYRNVEPARQKAAVQFLLEQAYKTPTWLLDASILQKLELNGSLSRVGSAQSRSLASLVSNDRLQRMIELEALASDKKDVYPVADMLADLRKGLWQEIESGAPIDAFRRRLQRVYLERMASKINPAPAAPSPFPAPGGGRGATAPVGTAEIRPILKSEMRALDADLAAAISRTSDRMTKAHLEDARDQIREMLDPKK
jgi:hypothetical protein